MSIQSSEPVSSSAVCIESQPPASATRPSRYKTDRSIIPSYRQAVRVLAHRVEPGRRRDYDASLVLSALTSSSWAIDSDVTEMHSPEEGVMTNQTPAPIDLTAFEDTIGNAFGDGTPTLWATASKDGVPDLAPKGSTMVWDKDHLAFWERAHGTTLENLRENPHAAM